MIGGDLNGDGVIDEADLAIYLSQAHLYFEAGADTPVGYEPPDPANPYHADISGDGLVSLEDFTSIQINAWKESEPVCASPPP